MGSSWKEIIFLKDCITGANYCTSFNFVLKRKFIILEVLLTNIPK